MRRLLGLLGLLLMAGGGWCAAPQRIVSLAPHTTEMAAILGLGDRLVAVSAYSDFPPEVAKLPQVAGYNGIQVERVVSYQPDLVLAWRGGNPESALVQLAGFNLPIFYSSPQTPEQLFDELLELGAITDRQPQAEQVVSALRQRLARLDARYRQRLPHRTLFYQLWQEPLMTSGGNGWLTPLLARCGADNIFADYNDPYPQVDRETVIARNPEVIIVGDGDPAQWRQWPQLTAVTSGHLHHLKPDLLQRMGPRIVDGLEELCAAIWAEPPEAPPATLGAPPATLEAPRPPTANSH